MKKKLLSMILGLSMVVSLTPSVAFADTVDASTQTDAEAMLETADYVPDQLLVSFDGDTTNKTIKKEVAGEDGTCIKITDVDNETTTAQVKIDDGQSLEEAIESYQDSPNVIAVQPNYKYTVNDTDPYLDNVTAGKQYMYHFDRINVFDAWKSVESSKLGTTKVTVIDTGVDKNHEDFKTEDGKDIIKDYRQVLNGKITEATKDNGSHGTHCSGIIAAAYGNGKGVAGVASGHNNNLCELSVISSSPDGEILYSSDILAAIKYACEIQNAQVVSMSFGVSARDYVMEKLIKKYYDENKTVFVASSGNDGNDAYNTPACYKSVISVNASNEDNETTYWSNYGTYSDVTAPGNNIISTLPYSYGEMSGTSMATPVVSAVVALMLDVNPNLTPAQVNNILCATARNGGKFDQMSAYGIIDAKEAVDAAKDASASTPVDSIAFKASEFTMAQGDYDSLEVLTLPATALGNISWSSDSANVTVDNQGYIKANSPGTATITAECNGHSTTCKVTVTAKETISGFNVIDADNLIPGSGDSGILENEGTYSLSEGSAYYLDCETLPKNNPNTEYNFESSDENIALIHENGELIANSPGTARITVYYYGNDSDNPLTVSFTVNVKKAARSISIKPLEGGMIVGETETLQVTARDKEDSEAEAISNYSFKSTNEAVASVDKNGKITANKIGCTYITATAKSGDKGYVSASFKLNVGKSSYTASDFALKGSSTYNSATLSWEPVSIATRYTIERSVKKGDFANAKTIDATSTAKSYKDTDGIKTGTTYYYMVTAYRGDTSLGSSAACAVKPSLAKPAVSLKAGKKSVKITYKKVSGANGYVIYRAASKSGKYSLVKTLSSSKTYYTNSGLKSGKKYYYKVRAYRTVDGKKIYSSYSTVKSATAK